MSVVIFTGLLFVVPHAFIPAELGNTILTVIAFLFGIIAGFYIVVTTTDYNSVKNILATEAAGWISLYQNVAIYDKKAADQLALLIDSFIIHAFDSSYLVSFAARAASVSIARWRHGTYVNPTTKRSSCSISSVQ